EDTRARYSEFPKISFDYEVAEKAESVAVVPFNGEWKDLGTWNTLTDELHHASIGNAVMGSHCENTHVINELQLPLYVDGLKDAVVAASPDGIFVCAKKYSEDIKKAVEHLTPRPMYEERRWGTYRVIDDSEYADGNHSLTKSITLKPGKNISYQLHHHRSEVWTFVEGEGIFVLDGEEKHVKAGDTVVIPLEHYHAIKAVTQLTFIEVQNGNPLVEEDIERFDYQWKMK
ncbi:cupin domain-containing protein, partial [Prevotella copri]|nr:cupin domain-containing protein [Segatella copri]